MAHGGGGGASLSGKIGTIFLVVIIIGVGLYFWNSGLIDKGAKGLGGLFPPLATTSSFFTSTPPGFGQPVIGPGAGTAGGSGAYGTPPPPPPITPPTPTTAAGTSPFFHEIQIGTLYAGFGSSYGEIVLYSYLNANESVDVTGWQIRGHHGNEYIPKAVEAYDPSGFAPAGDIRLSGAQTLYLYSSPGTINLRLNKCIGYLQVNLQTNPALPLSCPYINQSQISGFSGACQNYIQSVPACTVPNTYSSQVPANDYACQQFLSNMNYKGCFNAHRSDADFLSNQWWAWTGNNILDPYHDVVDLYDKNGLLVDERTY